jgi:ketosteroid isomerase-like protein
MKIMRIAILSACILLSFQTVSIAQTKDESAIRKILSDQTEQWNKGDLEKFMEGYWHSDSLMFIGKSGITYGYSNALKNYQTGYSDTVQMGKLRFELVSLKPISNDHYFVVGKWFLNRSIGDLSGVYTLLFRKIKGEWFIIVDHSS